VNARTRLKREIIRHRRTRPWSPTITRFRLPNGALVRVVDSVHGTYWRRTGHAGYRVRYALLSAPFPPHPETISELARWA
jgi:hypothetical protein